LKSREEELEKEKDKTEKLILDKDESIPIPPTVFVKTPDVNGIIRLTFSSKVDYSK